MSRSGIITLTTDFGAADTWVGVMKGVILSIFPAARIVDLTHAIPAHDVRAAALTLIDAVPYFPRGTVHLVVVDPGVGSDRKALAARKDGHFFVGPDNGVFSGFLPGEYVLELNRPELFLPRVSRSFHGRDVFAPVAARLAEGRSLRDLGSPLADPIMLDLPRAEPSSETVRGEVVRVDRFGNLITNIPERLLPPAPLTVEIGAEKISGLRLSYAEADPGRCAALVGSTGRLEIALFRGSAAEKLGVGVGEKVTARSVGKSSK
jgi:S-adenosyl-L-methionine hydrolase (adenosine-forming)